MQIIRPPSPKDFPPRHERIVAFCRKPSMFQCSLFQLDEVDSRVKLAYDVCARGRAGGRRKGSRRQTVNGKW